MDWKVIATVVIFLLVQTGSLIWFLASIKKDISFLTAAVQTLQSGLLNYVTGEALTEKLKRVWDRIESAEKNIKEVRENCTSTHRK